MTVNRRRFFQTLSLGGLFTAFSFSKASGVFAALPQQKDKPGTNIRDVLKYPRTPDSMPGKFPARVVQVYNPLAVKHDKIDPDIAGEMLRQALITLTGKKDINQAWLTFVAPNDRVGLKVNPVAGKLLSTSVELVQAIVNQLVAAGIPRSNLIIWDRREFQLSETGFTPENFPDIPLIGTERQDAAGSFYDADGKLLSEQMIDKNWYYWADVEEKYDKDTLPYMVNEGKYSYFSTICTQKVDKIINIPILKNAGSSVTIAMKNLAFGSITNTGRLHKDLWSETCAEVCAFPPLRDKVVLNIVDGLRGCYQGGPSANPQFITNFNLLLASTDPVAIDRVGYDIILKKRIEMNIQKTENPSGRKFLELAGNLGLGEPNLDKIDKKIIQPGV